MPYLPTIKPEEVQLLFAAQLDLFDPVLRQPIDADLMRICEDLTTILLPLPYNAERGIHNMMGLVMEKDNYEQRYRSEFPTPTKPKQREK